MIRRSYTENIVKPGRMIRRYRAKTITIVLVIVCHLFAAGCARRLSPARSFENIDTNAEKKRLERFIDGGTEKEINTNNLSADALINAARQYLGVPHCMGGTSSKCMDCSGLLFAVFRKFSISLPHNSEEQARYGAIIPRREDLKKGDLVFFIRTYRTSNFITHAGICTGNNEFIHASTSNGVTITSLYDPWWDDKFIFGTKVLK
jgi:cell wall-associated NlpC family hydrolase